MPRTPEIAPVIRDRPPSPYSALAERLASYEGEVYRLNVGDTWMEPPEGCRMEDFRVADHPGMHRYAPIRGIPPLLEAISARAEQRTGVPTRPENVLVGAGVTSLLDVAARTLVAPGEEVIILSPHWPLVAGAVRGAHGVAVQVPFFGAVTNAEEAVAQLARHVTPRTVALYLNTPSNPTGRLLPRDWIEAIARWAQAQNLWIWADEVYEDYVWGGPHVYTRPFAPERTLSFHSFSKAYGMAGNRCGYVIGPADAIAQILKASTYTFYSTPTAAQLAGVQALGPAGDRWIEQARERYETTGRAAAKILGVPEPDGCTFLFLDIKETLQREFGDADDALLQFLGRCAGRGLVVAPGPSFGPYPTSVRVCFTSEPPEKALRGFELLARLLAEPGAAS